MHLWEGSVVAKWVLDSVIDDPFHDIGFSDLFLRGKGPPYQN